MTEITKDVDLKLQNIVDKIEKLEAEKKTISEYIADTYKEASSGGFDNKILRKLIAQRKLELDARLEADVLLETYMEALGMITNK